MWVETHNITYSMLNITYYLLYNADKSQRQIHKFQIIYTFVLYNLLKESRNIYGSNMCIVLCLEHQRLNFIFVSLCLLLLYFKWKQIENNLKKNYVLSNDMTVCDSRIRHSSVSVNWKLKVFTVLHAKIMACESVNQLIRLFIFASSTKWAISNWNETY